MGYLIQSPSTIADCLDFTLSAWVKFPTYSSADNFGVLQFGNPSSLHGTSHVAMSSHKFIANIIGPNISLPEPYSGLRIGQFTNLQTRVIQVTNTWNHLFVAFSLSDRSGHFGNVTDSPYNPNNFYIYVNAANAVDYSSHVYYNGSAYVPETTGLRHATANGLNDTVNAPDAEAGSGILVNGWQVGMPYLGPDNQPPGSPYTLGTALDAAEGITKDFSDVQVWFGTFIDPTIAGNLSKFVRINGSTGKPENPSVAAAAFGAQSILFKGKASDASFQINQGNGGSFTKIGTLSDVASGPSY